MPDPEIENGSDVSCIGCGYCCVTSPCKLSLDLFAGSACSALIWHETKKRHVCGLLYLEEYRVPGAVGVLRIATGCDYPCNSWRAAVLPRIHEEADYARLSLVPIAPPGV